MSSEGFSYATLKLGDQIVGGIGGLGDNVPAATPAHWSTYFAVADTDAALATVAGLGGSVVQRHLGQPLRPDGRGER